MKRMFYQSFLTIDPSKTGVNSLCAPGIQGLKRCSCGLIEKSITGRKSVFRPANTGMKRIIGIVKMLRVFSQVFDCVKFRNNLTMCIIRLILVFAVRNTVFCLLIDFSIDPCPECLEP